MEDSFTKPVDEVVNYFKTDENTGLTDEQIQRYQEKYGPNGTHATFSFSDSISKDAVTRSDYFSGKNSTKQTGCATVTYLPFQTYLWFLTTVHGCVSPANVHA